MKRLALFGLSANPPTGLGGHQGMVRRLVESSRYDEVWVVPVYTHRFSAKRNQLVAFEHRLAMCRLAFEPETSASTVVKVVSLEETVFNDSNTGLSADETPRFPGTIDVIDYLRRSPALGDQYDMWTLTLVLGGDTFIDLVRGKWKESTRLLREVRFHVFYRQSTGTNSTECEDIVREGQERSEVYLDPHLMMADLSSTGVRETLMNRSQVDLAGEDSTPFSAQVMHADVASYIYRHDLYVKEV